MNRLALVVLSWALLPALAAADDAGRAVVEKAIEAHGGPSKIAKLRVMRIKAEGTITLAPGQAGVPFVIEDWWQMPDQYKTTFRYELGGKRESQTQAVDGQAGWLQVNGQVQDLPKEAVAEMREQKYAEDMDRLGFLVDKEVEVTALDETKAGTQKVVGVVIKSKGHRDVKLYFDAVSSRLAKREHVVLDGATGRDIVQGVVFGDYRETDGAPHYHMLTAYRGGKKFVEAKVVEVEFFDKLDKKVFAKP